MRAILVVPMLLALASCGGSDETASQNGGASCSTSCQGLVCGSGVNECGQPCTSGCLYDGCKTPYPCTDPAVCSPTLSPAAYTRCIADCEGKWQASHAGCCAEYVAAHPSNTCR